MSSIHLFASVDAHLWTPAFVAGGGHTLRAERGMGGSIFWKTREIGLSSYSNNLYTVPTFEAFAYVPAVNFFPAGFLAVASVHAIASVRVDSGVPIDCCDCGIGSQTL